MWQLLCSIGRLSFYQEFDSSYGEYMVQVTFPPHGRLASLQLASEYLDQCCLRLEFEDYVSRQPTYIGLHKIQYAIQSTPATFRIQRVSFRRGSS